MRLLSLCFLSVVSSGFSFFFVPRPFHGTTEIFVPCFLPVTVFEHLNNAEVGCLHHIMACVMFSSQTASRLKVNTEGPPQFGQ